MRYRIVHRTRYRYSAPVARCRNEAHLRPRDTDRQECLASEVAVEPTPTSWSDRTDFYGNPLASFVVDGPFDELTVTATSSVEVGETDPLPVAGPTWEDVRTMLAEDLSRPLLDVREFCFSSPLVTTSRVVRSYAEQSFPAGRPLVDSITELTRRIHEDFVYDPGFTTVTTPLEEVLVHRRGVCQDFAHLAVGCVRSMGLAARYVSGYLETAPAPGGDRLVGADASHAWPSVYVPGWGWLDVDPTNNEIVGSTYVTTAWGRDYADVSPLKGIVFGGGDSHTLDVAVDVSRVADRQPGARPGRTDRPSEGVDQGAGGHRQIVDELLAVRRGHVEGIDSGGHVPHPPLGLGGADDEPGVTHAQAGMAALLVVGGGPAPVLHEEQGEVRLRLGEVLGVHGAEHGIGGHAGVERLDQGDEERLAAPAFEGRPVGLPGHSHASTVGRGRLASNPPAPARSGQREVPPCSSGPRST